MLSWSIDVIIKFNLLSFQLCLLSWKKNKRKNDYLESFFNSTNFTWTGFYVLNSLYLITFYNKRKIIPWYIFDVKRSWYLPVKIIFIWNIETVVTRGSANNGNPLFKHWTLKSQKLYLRIKCNGKTGTIFQNEIKNRIKWIINHLNEETIRVN